MRPIDLQHSLAKTQAAERIAQIQKAHGEVGQKQIAEAFKKQAADAMNKAKATEKADMVIIGNEENEERQKEKNKKKKMNLQNETNKTSEPNEDDATEHLDITG